LQGDPTERADAGGESDQINNAKVKIKNEK
jgi:hypothetical protein